MNDYLSRPAKQLPPRSDIDHGKWISEEQHLSRATKILCSRVMLLFREYTVQIILIGPDRGLKGINIYCTPPMKAKYLFLVSLTIVLIETVWLCKRILFQCGTKKP